MKCIPYFLFLLLGGIAFLFGLMPRSSAQQRKLDRLNQALIAAVKRNDTKTAIALLNQGADANCYDESDQAVVRKCTPLLLALQGKTLSALKPSTPYVYDGPLLAHRYHPIDHVTIDYTIFPPENLPLIKALLHHKAHVNVMNEAYETPLFLAIEAQKEATVHLLLQYGAGRKLGRDYYDNPLVDAIVYDNREMFSDMLRQGLDVNQHRENENTALTAAVSAQEVAAVRLLLSYHANVTLRGYDGMTPLAKAKRILAVATIPYILPVFPDTFIPPVSADTFSAEEVETYSNAEPAKAQQIIDLLQQAGAKE